MTIMRLSVSADSIDGHMLNDLHIDEMDRIHLSMAGEARCNGDEEYGAQHRCAECSEPVYDDRYPYNPEAVKIWTTGKEGGATCPQRECESCLGTGINDDSRAGNVCESCSGAGFLPHVPVDVPLSWCNSISAELDEKADTVSVSISTGDPRGGFRMAIERVRLYQVICIRCNGCGQDLTGICTQCAGTGKVDIDELRLSVPSPEAPWLHQPLTALNSRGYYRIGDR